MKRIISLILALSCIFAIATSLVSCGGGSSVGDLYVIARESEPTKIVTDVYYKDTNKQALNGRYVMQIEGNNSIFEYQYDRYRTVEEGVVDGSDERIKTVSGVVYFKDGKYSTDGEAWDSEAVTAIDLKFDLKAEYLTDAVISADGTVLTATMTAENAVKVVGTDLSVKEGESVSIEVKTNGTNLTFITLSCETAKGSLKIITSYSYNKLTLEFPEA